MWITREDVRKSMSEMKEMKSSSTRINCVWVQRILPDVSGKIYQKLRTIQFSGSYSSIIGYSFKYHYRNTVVSEGI